MKGPYLLSFFLLFSALQSQAQNGTVIYRFTCQQTLSASSEKFIFEELVAIDPMGEISVDGQQVKVKVSHQIGEHRVSDALQESGVCDPLLSLTPNVPKSSGFLLDPVDLMNSVSLLGDDADLKQAWRHAHPKAFQEYQRTLRQVPPVPYE